MYVLRPNKYYILYVKCVSNNIHIVSYIFEKILRIENAFFFFEEIHAAMDLDTEVPVIFSVFCSYNTVKILFVMSHNKW